MLFSNLICQNPNFRTRQEKNQHLTDSLIPPEFLAKGRSLFFIWALRWQKSIQKHRPPSFFLTSTTMLHHTLWLGHMVPKSSISCRWLQTSSTKGGICQNCSLKGISLVILIMCSVEWVQPSSLGSKEKTSWYLTRSDWAEPTSPRGHDSKPLRPSSSNNLSCLCFTVNLDV